MKAEAGFSLVELLVAMLVTTMVVGGLYTMFDSAQTFSESYADSAALRQQARVGLDMLATELRSAGYDLGNLDEPLTVASDTSVQFVGDIDAGDTAEPCGASFENASGGGAERVTYTMAADTGELTRTVDCYDGTGWTTGAQTSVLAEDLDVNSVVFRYFDGEGNQLPSNSGGTLSESEREEVAMIEIIFDMIDGETQLVGQSNVDLNLSTRVRLHNVVQ
jgi:type IV pilus assembly protein PilW